MFENPSMEDSKYNETIDKERQEIEKYEAEVFKRSKKLGTFYYYIIN